MKRLALCFLATTMMVPAAAYAQDPVPPPPEAMAADAVAAEAVAAHARYQNYRRLERGGMVPNYWWGPAFMVVDWSGYGLHQPQPGYRWIRYYDDALLIDSYGRIVDGRYDMDWSPYAGWTVDAHGIPIFADVQTEGYGLDHHAGGYNNQQGSYAYPGSGYAYPGYSQAYPGYGNGYQGGYNYGGYGYGYGQAGGVVTETTVTRECAGGAAVVDEGPPPAPPPLPPPPGERG
jgi:Ni/Co efflux regulator RcnB